MFNKYGLVIFAVIFSAFFLITDTNAATFEDVAKNPEYYYQIDSINVLDGIIFGESIETARAADGFKSCRKFFIIAPAKHYEFITQGGLAPLIFVKTPSCAQNIGQETLDIGKSIVVTGKIEIISEKTIHITKKDVYNQIVYWLLHTGFITASHKTHPDAVYYIEAKGIAIIE